MNPDERLEIIRRHVAALMEHFDTVQVFASRCDTESEQTTTWQQGNGNWYARYGQVQEWMVQQAERAAVQVRKEGDDG